MLFVQLQFLILTTASCIPSLLSAPVSNKNVPSAMEEILLVNNKANLPNVNFGDEMQIQNQFSLNDDFLLHHKRRKRALLKYLAWRWPGGEVAVVMSEDFPRNIKDDIIRKAMQNIEDAVSCIKFTEYQDGFAPNDHIYIFPGNGCWSFVGRTGWRQGLSLQNPGCVSNTGIVMHELLHALGFFHEQSREDRDDHVRINLHNIRAGFERNFDKESFFTIQDGFGVPYDIKSIMHYSKYAFSTGNGPTIESKDMPDEDLGGSVLTSSDVKQLGLYYGCNKVEPVTTTPTTAVTEFATTTTEPTMIIAEPTTTKTTTDPTMTVTEETTTATESTTIKTEPTMIKTESTTTTTEATTTTPEATTTTTEANTATTEANTATTEANTATTEANTATTEATTITTEATTTTTEATTTTIEATTTTTEAITTTTEATTTTITTKATNDCEDTKNWCSATLSSYCSNALFLESCQKSCGCKK